MKRSLLILGLVFAGTSQGRAQGLPILDGLRAQVQHMGGCMSDPDTASFRSPFYPTVRFVRGTCTLEHGDPTSGVVAVDSDGVFLLLGTEEGFRFLELRHPPIGVDSASAVDYVMTALELSGSISSQAQHLIDLADAPLEARKRITPSPRLTSISAANHRLRVGLYVRVPLYESAGVDRWEVVVGKAGTVMLGRTSVWWPPARTT
jgi:hypothetical protein